VDTLRNLAHRQARRECDPLMKRRRTACPDEPPPQPLITRSRRWSSLRSPVRLSERLLPPHRQMILGSRTVFWIWGRACGFVEPLQFHSAMAARRRARLSLVGVPRLSERLLIHPTLRILLAR